MSDKITLDRETFKVLAADTRIEILKKLEKHKETLSDLAEETHMSPSTIKEHLDRLVSAGLIEQEDKGMKWKYYKLTAKGKGILNPYETKVWILLVTSALLLGGAVFRLVKKLSVVPVPKSNRVFERVAPVVAGSAAETLPAVADAGDKALSTIQFPYVEIILILIFAIVTGFCIGYIAKRKSPF